MDLLKQVMEHPIDEDYAAVATRGERSSRRGLLLAVTLVALGALLTVAIVQNIRTAPVRATERQELIDRIETAADRQDEARALVVDQQAEVRRLQQSGLGTSEADQELRERLRRLELTAGTIPVHGPGVVVVVDDGPGRDPKGRVMDIDLQQLVKGLWGAGAEAIAINGHRVSSRSAIRGAGDAITVNYRSLTHPYRVEAVGDPRTLEARYVETAGGMWWNGLMQNYGMRHEVDTLEDITLPGDAGLTLRHAKKGER